MVKLQMAQPLAVMQGVGGADALARSTTMMTPLVWQYAGTVSSGVCMLRDDEMMHNKLVQPPHSAVHGLVCAGADARPPSAAAV